MAAMQPGWRDGPVRGVLRLYPWVGPVAEDASIALPPAVGTSADDTVVDTVGHSAGDHLARGTPIQLRVFDSGPEQVQHLCEVVIAARAEERRQLLAMGWVAPARTIGENPIDETFAGVRRTDRDGIKRVYGYEAVRMLAPGYFDVLDLLTREQRRRLLSSVS